MVELKNLAETIREIRNRMGLTQEELASKVGFTGGYIAQIESGKRLPNPQTLSTLCKVLGLPKSEEATLLQLYDQGRRLRVRERMEQRALLSADLTDQADDATPFNGTRDASTIEDVNVILDGRVVSAAHYHIVRDLDVIENDLRALAAAVGSNITTLPSVSLLGLGRCGTNIAVRVSTLAYQAKKDFFAVAESDPEVTKKKTKESAKTETLYVVNEWLSKRVQYLKEFLKHSHVVKEPIYLVEPIVLIADLDADLFGRVKASGYKEILEANDSKLKQIELSDVHRVGAGNVPLVGQYLAKIILNGPTSTFIKDVNWKNYHSYLIDSAGFNINPSRVFFYIFSAGGGTGSGMSSEFALAQQYSYHHRVHSEPEEESDHDREDESPGFEPIFSAGIAILPHFNPRGGEYSQAVHVNAGRLMCKYLSEEWRFSKTAYEEERSEATVEHVLRPWNALMLISNNIMSHIEQSEGGQKIDVMQMEERANQYVAQQIFNILTAQAQTKDYDEQYFMKAGISRKETVGVDPNDLYMSLTGPLAIAYAESMNPAKGEPDKIKDVFSRSISLPSLNKQTHAIEGISILPQPPEKYADTLIQFGKNESALSSVKLFTKCSATLSIISMPKGEKLANSEFSSLKLLMDRVFPHTRIKRYSLVVGTSEHLSLTTIIARSACLSDEVLTLLFAYIKRCFAKDELKYSAKIEEEIKNYLINRSQDPARLKDVLKDLEDPSEVMEANWKDVKAMYERKYRTFLPNPRSFVPMDSIRLGVDDVINALKYVAATLRHQSVPLTPIDIDLWDVKG